MVWEKRDDKDHRRITKLKRWYDVAPVTYPANTDTEVAARSLESLKKVSESKNTDQAKSDQDLMKMDLELLTTH